MKTDPISAATAYRMALEAIGAMLAEFRAFRAQQRSKE